jgi:putative transcriptional regulator
MENKDFFENLNFYEGLKSSLEEAAEYERGNKGRCRVSVRELPVPKYDAEDIMRTRKQLHLSQRGLASAMGVSPRTVEAWETGRNVPSGAARHLLYLLEKENRLVDYLIAK